MKNEIEELKSWIRRELANLRRQGFKHASSHVTNGGDTIPSVIAAGNAGLMTGTDKTKLDGIATGASVTSVGISAPTQITVTNSPVTSAGTIALTWATQAINLVFASPASGAAGVPIIRALVENDIPALSPGKISGTTANQVLATPSGGAGAIALISLAASHMAALLSTANTWTANQIINLSGAMLTILGSGATGGKIKLENADSTVAIGEEFGRVEFYSNDSTAGGTGISGYIANVAVSAGPQTAIAIGVRTGAGGNAAEGVRVDHDGAFLVGKTTGIAGAGNIDANARIKGDSFETAAGNKWKLATYTAAGDAVSNGYVTVTIDGVAYKLSTRA